MTLEFSGDSELSKLFISRIVYILSCIRNIQAKTVRHYELADPLSISNSLFLLLLPLKKFVLSWNGQVIQFLANEI